MIPRCPVCNSLAGTSRTAAGKRMWCTSQGLYVVRCRGGGRVDRTGYVRRGDAVTPGTSSRSICGSRTAPSLVILLLSRCVPERVEDEMRYRFKVQ